MHITALTQRMPPFTIEAPDRLFRSRAARRRRRQSSPAQLCLSAIYLKSFNSLGPPSVSLKNIASVFGNLQFTLAVPTRQGAFRFRRRRVLGGVTGSFAYALAG